MKPPFDIAGDLDTPVSAFAKLASFRPRFLLESVEGGERLGRYSFLGFGDGLEVRLDAAGLAIGAERRPVRCRPGGQPGGAGIICAPFSVTEPWCEPVRVPMGGCAGGWDALLTPS